MRRFALACFIAVSTSPAAASAGGGLPSLHTEAAAAPAEPFAELARGSLEVPFGSLDYRFVRRGLQADVRIGGRGAGMLIGYGGGAPRVELAEWRAYRGNVRLALTAHEGDGAYRIEFARDF